MTSYDRNALLAGVDLPTLADELLGGQSGSTRSPTWPCPVPTHAQTGRTPPVSVFTTRWGEQRWRCHGCGASGSAIDMVMQAKGLDVRQAMDWLASRMHVSPRVRDVRPAPRHRVERPVAIEPHPGIDEYVHACESVLWSTAGRGPLHWLTDTRCLSEEVLRLNRVGFDPGARHLERPVGVPRSAGIVLPVLDDNGRAIFTQTRRLGRALTGPRYLNCAAQVAPNPRLALYRAAGWEVGDHLVVCEGAIDALTAAGAGIRSAAALGSTLADARVADRLASYGVAITIGFDADDAGDHGAASLASLLKSRGCHPTRLRPPPEYGDLNQWRVTLGDAWADLVKTDLTVRVDRGRAAVGRS